MVISDFFHCDNIQDRAVKSHRFETMLVKERQVGNDFKCLNRRQVGGSFLDHNCRICSNQNRILVWEDANIFGLSWMNDGATIYCMPLVDNIVMCADVLPMVVDI